MRISDWSSDVCSSDLSSFRERQPACPSSRIERQEHQVTRDSKERYGRISRFLHWGMALLIGWQLLKIFDRVADGENWIGQTLVPWHVSIGTLLLLLIAFRTVCDRQRVALGKRVSVRV